MDPLFVWVAFGATLAVRAPPSYQPTARVPRAGVSLRAGVSTALASPPRWRLTRARRRNQLLTARPPARSQVQALVVWVILHYYGRQGQRDCGLMTVSVLVVTLTLGLVMLLPADVYIVSHLDDIINNDDLELDGKLRAISQRTQVVQYASYALWGGSACLSFIVIPFMYFFYEEEELYGFEARRAGSHTCAALKYVVLFLLIVGVLAGVALGIKPGLTVDELTSDPDFEWLSKWSQVVPLVAQAFNFLMVIMACVGLLSWICYTAVGLAYMPIDILKGQKHIDRLEATIEERESLLGNRYSQIREKAWRQGVGSLSRRERRDAEISEQSRLALNQDRNELKRNQTELNSCLNKCPCIRYVVGLLLLLLSLLVLEAAAVSALDVTIHNTGLQRGFVLTEGSLRKFNLLDLALSFSCEAGTGTFVEVYVMIARFAGLAILTLYIISSTMYGMFTVGLCWVSKIKPHRTWPQSLLVASFVLVFTLWGMVLTLPALAPPFFDYGCQQQPGAVEADPPRECTRGAASPYCTNTQFLLVSAWMRISLPPLGVLVFVANWVSRRKQRSAPPPNFTAQHPAATERASALVPCRLLWRWRC